VSNAETVNEIQDSGAAIADFPSRIKRLISLTWHFMQGCGELGELDLAPPAGRIRQALVAESRESPEP